MTSREPTRVVVARGPRAAESELLGMVARLAPRHPRELGPPLRVIVPSASLRRHLLARLVASSGRALAGVVVQTLQQVALEVLERAGEDDGRGAATFELLVRRSAARDPGLREALANLDDGYGAVEAAVRDLLDAGYGLHHQEAVLEKIGELRQRVSPPRRRRARALVLIASEVADRLDELESHRPEQAPQRAAETLRRLGPAALPSRALVIHGFADHGGDFCRADIQSDDDLAFFHHS